MTLTGKKTNGYKVFYVEESSSAENITLNHFNVFLNLKDTSYR